MGADIDTTFQTMQRDLFTSGIAAQIGMNSFGVWQAIKSHADKETGECWPSQRRLGEMTGLSLGAVNKCVETLEKAKLLRVVAKGGRTRATTYVARERLDVRLGERVLCTVVIDYVPKKIGKRLEGIEKAIREKTNPDAFAECEIIPGAGFEWDASKGVLKASIPAEEVPEQVLSHYPQSLFDDPLLLKDS
jgi:DNA-binding transcriptional regulator YhcF (GntR family)